MRLRYPGLAGSRVALCWLLLLAAGLGLARALIVPPSTPAFGYNIDEDDHFTVIVGLATSLRAVLPDGDLASLGKLFLSDKRGADRTRGSVYYLLQALPQLLLPPTADDWTRLLVARLLTVSLHLVMVGLVYRMLRELFPGALLWALGAAVFMALVPAIGHMMSGVSLDAGGALVGTLILYALALILRRGLGWARGLGLGLSLVLGYLLKGTAWPLFLVAAFALGLRMPRWAQLALGVAALAVGGAVLFRAGALVEHRTAHWYYARSEWEPGAVLPPRVEDAAVGQHSLAFSAADGVDWIVQYLPERQVAALRGEVVSYGVWMRAPDGAARVRTPFLGEGDDQSGEEIYPSSEWKFYGGTAVVGEDAEHLAFFLGAPVAGALVLYDGMVLAEGEYPVSQPPTYLDDMGKDGAWGSRGFVNLLQNPSAEVAWLQAPPELGDPYKMNDRLVALFAWQRTASAWFRLPRWWLTLFWANWDGVVPALSYRQALLLGLLTVAAAFGAGLVLVRDFPRRIAPFNDPASRLGLAMLLATAVMVGGLLLYRTYLVPYKAQVLVWSSTRHASPGFAAISALLAIGLLRCFPPRVGRWALTALVVGLFALNVYLLLAVQMPYYECVHSSYEANCLRWLP